MSSKINLQRAIKVGQCGRQIEIVCRSRTKALISLFGTLHSTPPIDDVRKTVGWMLCTCSEKDPPLTETILLLDERLRQRYGPTADGRLKFIGLDFDAKANVAIQWTDGATAFLIRQGKIIENLATTIAPRAVKYLGGRGIFEPKPELAHANWRMQPKDRLLISPKPITDWIGIDQLIELAGRGPCGVAAPSISTIIDLQAGRAIPLMIVEFDPSEDQANVDSLGLGEDGGYFVDALLGLEETLSDLLPLPFLEEKGHITEPFPDDRSCSPPTSTNLVYEPPTVESQPTSAPMDHPTLPRHTPRLTPSEGRPESRPSLILILLASVLGALLLLAMVAALSSS